MKILQLKAENVKKIEAICITPDPKTNVITLGGVNGSGKSSCLDSILYGISGGRDIPEVPVRRGEERALIELDLGDLKIRRTISANGNMTLQVTNADGAKYSSPQSILDALMSKVGFDPLEFSRQKPAEQYETLRALAGLDFTAIDKQRQDAYEQRTLLGREIKTLEGQLVGLPQHPDAPAEEVSTVGVMEKWREAAGVNSANETARSEFAQLKKDHARLDAEHRKESDQVAVIEEEIRKLHERLDIQRQIVNRALNRLNDSTAALDAKATAIARLQDVDLNPFKDQVQNADGINRRVRQNQQRAKVSTELTAKRQQHTALDQKVENLDIEKRRMISKAKLPIEGLSFEAGRVVLNSIPFSQLSSAEQLKVSVAVGLALNPKLKVLLIRDGSLLDENSLKMVAEMAAAADGQVWVEIVGTDGDLSVIIEDGMVKGAPRPAPVVETAELPAAPTVESPTQPASTPAPTPKRGRKAKPDQEAFTDIFA